MLQYNPSISGSLSVTGSLIVTNGMIGTISGVDVQVFSSSISQVVTNIQITTGSQNSRLGSIESFTSSTSARLGSIETISASNLSRIGSLETISASNIARISSLETTSASVDTLNIAQNTRLTNLENKTGSLATTGSNTFIGTQTITGSLYISSDLIVQGSSSLQNITASAVSIGTNIVNLNTANPAIRYAGLVIGDSGSIGSSGSFFYDSVQDEMIFVHRGANTTVTSSVVLMGPQTYDAIGTETYPTSNRIQKGTGNEHLVDSNIFDDGTTISLKSNSNITGSLELTSNIKLGAAGNIDNVSTIQYGGYTWNSYNTSTGVININNITTNLTLSGSGVGIGTTAPEMPLELRVADGKGIRIKNSTFSDKRWDIVVSGNGFAINETGTAARLFISGSSGYIGIGTVNPSAVLHVVVPETQSQTNSFKITGDTNGKAIVLGANTNYSWIQSHGSVPLYINELGNNVIFNSGGGSSVGIGTTNLNNILHLYKSSGTVAISLQSSTNYGYLFNDGTNIGLASDAGTTGQKLIINRTAPDSTIVVASSGKVGIGTDGLSGTAKFLVNGGIGFSGDTDRYLFMPDVGQGTGSIYMQAGFGSAQAGGAVRLYGHNATSFTGGDVEVGLSGKGNFLINSYIGGGRLVTVKVNGNVGINDTNPGEKLDVNGNTRIQGTTMIGSNVGLLQFGMDGTRFNHYGFSHVHIKTSILKGSDTMISFNLRGYYYSPNTIDTDIAFYNYNPVSYVYNPTAHVKAYGGLTITMYYSSDNYVCICVEGLGTYGGFALNWINTSLIQWGGRVFALAWSRVNTSSAQY